LDSNDYDETVINNNDTLFINEIIDKQNSYLVKTC